MSELENSAYKIVQEGLEKLESEDRVVLFCNRKGLVERMAERLGCLPYHSFDEKRVFEAVDGR